MADRPKCRGYPFLICAGRVDECYNESCVRRDKCCSEVLVSADATLVCQKPPHRENEKHLVEVKEHFGSTMVTISWPAKKDLFDERDDKSGIR